MTTCSGLASASASAFEMAVSAGCSCTLLLGTLLVTQMYGISIGGAEGAEGRPAMECGDRVDRRMNEGDDADQAHNAIAKQPLIFIDLFILCIIFRQLQYLQ